MPDLARFFIVAAVGAPHDLCYNGIMATTVLAEITPEQQQFLSSVAHLVWWEPRERALQRPDYLVRQVMRYGTLEQSAAIEKLFPRATLQNILLGAEAGQLNHRSWNFWYARLFDCPRYEDIAPFPTRGTQANAGRWS